MQDDGYFPRSSSVLRRVHEQRAVGLHYGQRALCIGACKPLNYVGTSLHSDSRTRPFRRLAATAKMFETVFFGTCLEADRVLEAVRGMHKRVVGVLPEDQGPAYPAGTPYAADDPHLMLWTIAAMADSALYFYELLVGGLSAAERDVFWGYYVRFGELFGMDVAVAPGGYEDFSRWWQAQLAGDDLFLGEEARYIGHASAFEIPIPPLANVLKPAHDLLVLGSLPGRVRELYGLSWSARQHAAFKLLVGISRAARPLVPGALACGYNTRSFAMVAGTERRRIEQGHPTPRLVD